MKRRLRYFVMALAALLAGVLAFPFITMAADPTIYEVVPQLNQTKVGVNGVPTIITRGIFTGYSLPIWSDPANVNEELYYNFVVPFQWNETTDIETHIAFWLDTANTDKKVKFELSWEHIKQDGEVVPLTSNLVYVELDTGTAAQYLTFHAIFIVDYDIDGPGNLIEIEDHIAIRLRRVDATVDEIAGEVVIFHVCMELLRGDQDGLVSDAELGGYATTGDLTGYVTTGEVQDVADVFQGLILLIPLIVFSILAFWKRHPVLFMIVAGIAIITGLKIPDILTGATTPLSLSLGILTVMYAFVCVAMAYRVMFNRRGESYGA